MQGEAAARRQNRRRPRAYVLAFESTHAAMAADRAFAAEGDAALIPTPRAISAGCGMPLKFAAEGDAAAPAGGRAAVEARPGCALSGRRRGVRAHRTPVSDARRAREARPAARPPKRSCRERAVPSGRRLSARVRLRPAYDASAMAPGAPARTAPMRAGRRRAFFRHCARTRLRRPAPRRPGSRPTSADRRAPPGGRRTPRRRARPVRRSPQPVP